MFDKESFEAAPNVPGFLSYRADTEKLYVNNGSEWKSLVNEEEVVYGGFFIICA